MEPVRHLWASRLDHHNFTYSNFKMCLFKWNDLTKNRLTKQGIFNVNIKNDSVEQHTRISKVNVSDGTSYQEVVPNKETGYALLANFFLSEGIPGKVDKTSSSSTLKRRQKGCHF